ncbi:MAG: HAD-IIB family hydrolase [bacterium]
MAQNSIYIQLFSIHGLLRGQNLEMGRNADTGGQVKYVVELARALGRQPGVAKVDLFTRLLRDKTLSPDYSQPVELLGENVRIVRIQCGGTRYIRKELLWPHLDEFVDKMLQFIKLESGFPDVMHGHYADAGDVALELSNLLDVPFIFTGHSLGRNKKISLFERGLSEEEMNKKYRIDHRIAMEEKIIQHADLIVTSSRQEIEGQYGWYEASKSAHFCVIAPGFDNQRLYPYYETVVGGTEKSEREKHAHFFMRKELERFLSNPDKPLILALSRPVRKKNIPALILAYGRDKELQAIANLAIFAGIRKDIATMDDNEREVLTELLLLMDKFDLYGKLAIPKRHDSEYEVPELYRLAARTQGVFVNPAFTEPFGLTLIEAAACGLPIVATNDGGPREVVQNCNNGFVVDVNRSDELGAAIKKILVERELWKQFSLHGIQGVRTHYSWDTHCERYLGEAHKLLTTPSPAQPETGGVPVIGKRLSKMTRMLVTDIDDTLLGDEKALARLVAFIKQHRRDFCFGVATGRSLGSALAVLAKHGVGGLDFIIASVGAEIHYARDWMLDQGWRSHISRHWHRERIQQLLAPLPFLLPQEETVQREFKLSYFMEESAENLAKIHEIIVQHRLRANLIYSGGKFLDVLPFRASKGKAVRYLCYKWSIPLEQVLVAGDSGNDEEMLRGEMMGVVVGNHNPELEKLRGLKRIYFSRGRYAAGIIDGIQHYAFLQGEQK